MYDIVNKVVIKMKDTGHSFGAYFKRAVSPLMVLSLLKDKPMYGYEISHLMTELSGGKLKIAILYPVLYRLEEQGYICEKEITIENGRARSYYEITEAGLEYLNRTLPEFMELSGAFMAVIRREEGSK